MSNLKSHCKFNCNYNLNGELKFCDFVDDNGRYDIKYPNEQIRIDQDKKDLLNEKIVNLKLFSSRFLNSRLTLYCDNPYIYNYIDINPNACKIHAGADGKNSSFALQYYPVGIRNGIHNGNELIVLH